jgi:cobalt-zinc-cadmium efflux system outer membrane protein
VPNRLLSVSFISLLGSSGLILTGCATVPKNAGFADVQGLVGERMGQVIEWNGNTVDDQAVQAEVNHMLSHDLTVDEAVQIALLNNLHLQATFEDLGVSQAEVVQAGLLKNPVFSGSWRFPDRAPYHTDAEYSVAEDFLDLLVLPLRKHVAEQAFEATKKSVAQQVMALAVETKVAYFTVQAREQLLNRLHLVVDLNQTAAQLANRQHEAGTLNELGAVNEQATYDQSKADLSQTEAQLAVDREDLTRLLCLWGGQTGWTIAGQLPPIPTREIPLAHLESLAMRQRLDLIAGRAQLTAFAHVVGVTETYRYFASIDVGVDTEKSPDGQNVTGPTLQLQIPIFDQGQAQVAKAQAELRQLQRRFEAMVIDARSQVREARDRMVAQRSIADSYKALLPERMKILSLTMEQYNGMLKGPYALLLAKQTEVATEQSYIDAWRDYWIARSELERAVGGRLPAIPPVATQPTTEMTADQNENQMMPGMKGMQP